MSEKATRSEFSEFDKRVGQAWGLNYKRQYDTAISQFRALVEEWPDHIDAIYGLALAYKNIGDKAKSREAFQKAKGFVSAELSRASGDTSRFQMLLRMIEQHLTTLA